MSTDRFYKFEDGKRVEMHRVSTTGKPEDCRVDFTGTGDFWVFIRHGGMCCIDACYFFHTLAEARAFCEGGWAEYRLAEPFDTEDSMRANLYVRDGNGKRGTILANYKRNKLVAGLEKTDDTPKEQYDYALELRGYLLTKLQLIGTYESGPLPEEIMVEVPLTYAQTKHLFNIVTSYLEE
jgi:hypothetical protein